MPTLKGYSARVYKGLTRLRQFNRDYCPNYYSNNRDLHQQAGTIMLHTKKLSATLEQIISTLGLEPHPKEGGWFKRTYESTLTLNTDGGERLLMSSIYYLLSQDAPIASLHRNQSDIMHYYHGGGAIQYQIIDQQGQLRTAVLGNRYERGELPQLLVKGGEWKATKLAEGEYGLLSEAVCPGFDFADNEIASDEQIRTLYPDLYPIMAEFIAAE